MCVSIEKFETLRRYGSGGGGFHWGVLGIHRLLLLGFRA